MVKHGRMQIAPEPTQQVTDTQAQPAGQLLLEAQRASPAQDCGRWQKPRPSTVWKHTQPGSWQDGRFEQVPPGQVGQFCVPQQSHAFC